MAGIWQFTHWVPDTQRLIAPAGQREQILLQRVDAKGVVNFKILQVPVGAIGIHKVFSITHKKARLHLLVTETGLIEIAQYGLIIRQRHSLRMVGFFPVFNLLGVASRALLLTDVISFGRQVSR